MTDLSFSLPPDLARRIESRIAGGEFVDAGDYLRDLVRRDLEDADETEWLREQIDIGRASGIIDKDPREVIEEIIAERRARRG
ncbi:MAG: type II toxin-antitoxin system ParD family antitoxin [Novosphingobium sp.]|nr:type II toxin-antitoxin system ParD family antitoxin [Novosphingobium sp.]